MKKYNISWITLSLSLMLLLMTYCKVPSTIERKENKHLPDHYTNNNLKGNYDSTSLIDWRSYFKDTLLISLIDTALMNNQELNIMLMEISSAQNEVQIRKGEYLPFLNLNAGTGFEKVGRYTSQGANDANTEIDEGKEFPEILGDLMISSKFSWEIDIWNKLRNAKKAAYLRYLSSVEGKNFMVTNLVSEIANSYYELLALDNQLVILKNNIQIQTNALDIVKQQMKSAKVSQLPVSRFEAFVLNTQSKVPMIEQKILETENKINFLLGRFPQPIARSNENFLTCSLGEINLGHPIQLLENRPDIKKTELELEACKLDVKVAKARFYPTLELNGNIGLQAFNPSYFLKAPESIIASLFGDLMSPLINKNEIKANFNNSNNKKIQAVYLFEQSILNAFIEVSNQVSNLENLSKSYELKSSEVEVLNQSVKISNSLFNSARADYIEVLLTQEEVLSSKFELVEIKKNQLSAYVNIYKSLGGGWQ